MTDTSLSRVDDSPNTETTHTPQLQRTITMRHAVALYISSVLGSGVLVLPGLAAQIAGPASLVAWLALSLASYPFAYTFASLSARRPESGGVYAFAKESFGQETATVAGWLFALWYISGGPAVTLIAASYISYAFPMSRGDSYIIAASVILLAFLVNYRGITFSNKIQIGVVLAIITLLVTAVAFSFHSIRIQNFTPFAPHGFLPIGTSAALIFWSFLGYENVSNIAEEFRNPERDFKRSIVLSVLLIGCLYIAVAVTIVGTGAYAAGGNVAPFAAIFSNILGKYGSGGTAVLALFIIFGTANAYTAGMARVVYAVARDGGFPQAIYHLNKKTGAPDRSLIMLVSLSMLVLVVYFYSEVNLETALFIPSGAAILVYIIGSASGVKLLRDRPKGKVLAHISLFISLAIMPFVGELGLIAIITGLSALGFMSIVRKRRLRK